ncbi:MAG: lysophospholipid acyltransferase family protein [Actinomycetota bacterium]|nr:lysophospholipid acyltransferase family protein [Actinomycetota bacterium]
MKHIRDWLTTIPTLAAFGLSLAVFHVVALAALPFGKRPFEKVMATLQRTLISVFAISGVRVDTKGRDGFATTGGYIFVSNHQSMYDVPIFGGLLGRNYPKYVAKRELAKGIPSVSLNLRHGGNALIDRGDRAGAMEAIREMASEAERRDVSVVIFPEGTRSRIGELGEFRVGGLTAIMEAAPNLTIIPTAIDGSWRVFQRNMFPVPYGAAVHVRFGEPIERVRGESPTEILERCRVWIEATIDEWRSRDPST